MLKLRLTLLNLYILNGTVTFNFKQNKVTKTINMGTNLPICSQNAPYNLLPLDAHFIGCLHTDSLTIYTFCFQTVSIIPMLETVYC